MMNAHNKSLYLAFAGLLALLIATIAINFAPLGAAHVWVGLAIAVTKTFIVVVIFMGLTKSSHSAQLAAGAGLLWLSFAMFLMLSDYMTRGWDQTQEHRLNKSEYTSYDRVRYPGHAAERTPSAKID